MSVILFARGCSPETTSGSRSFTCWRSRSSFSLAGVCGADSVGAIDARRRSCPGRHLQQIVHHARHHHGVLFPDSVDAGGAGQFSAAADDRRARSGVSRTQSCSVGTSTCSAAASRSGRLLAGGVDTGWTFYTPYSSAIRQYVCHRGGARRFSSPGFRRSSPA